MEKFVRVNQRTWEKNTDIAEGVLGNEAQAKADEILEGTNFQIAPDIIKPREVIHETDPFAPLPQAVKEADKILAENQTLATAVYDRGEISSNDSRFDHYGSNFTTAKASDATTKKEPKGLLKRLFGG